MLYSIPQIIYISMIHFLFTQSYFYYYLLLWFLIQYYWSFLNSNYWLYFILILYVYDQKFHIIYVISSTVRFLVLIVFLVIPSRWFFFSQHNGVISTLPLSIVFFHCFPWFPNCPWVKTLVIIAASIEKYFVKRSYYHHISSLVFSQNNGII